MSLKYYAESILPDLQQRKEALDLLFRHGADELKEDGKLRRFFAEDLGREAVLLDSMAFNNFDVAAAVAIQRFALEVSPEVRNSLPWIKLAFKQTIGPRCWYALNSIGRRYAEVV